MRKFVNFHIFYKIYFLKIIYHKYVFSITIETTNYSIRIPYTKTITQNYSTLYYTIPLKYSKNKLHNSIPHTHRFPSFYAICKYNFFAKPSRSSTTINTNSAITTSSLLPSCYRSSNSQKRPVWKSQRWLIRKNRKKIPNGTFFDY